MTITFNEIAELVARFGNSVVTEQANLAAPFIGKGTIKKEKHTGVVGIVNVKSGGLPATGFIADGGALPSGSNIQPHQLAYHPKALFSRLSIPRVAALTCISKQDGVNLVKEQMETVGADLGRTLGRAVFKAGNVTRPFAPAASYTFTSTGADDPAVATTNAPGTSFDTSPYRIGAAFIGLDYTSDDGDIADGPGALVVESINYSASPNTVTFSIHPVSSAGVIGAQLLVADTKEVVLSSSTLDDIRPADGGSIVNSMTSLLDLASATVAPAGTTLGTAGNYAGINATDTPDFNGSEVDAGGSLDDVEPIDNLSKQVKRRSGRPWTHLVMNSTNFHNYMSLLVANRRFVGAGQANDASTGATATYEGKPVIVDENMPDQTMLMFTDTDVKLAEWRGFLPDYDGKKAAMVSDSNLIYDTQIFGLYNLRCTKRNGLGKVTGITGGAWT